VTLIEAGDPCPEAFEAFTVKMTVDALAFDTAQLGPVLPTQPLPVQT
jgi:hypothetical protein